VRGKKKKREGKEKKGRDKRRTKLGKRKESGARGLCKLKFGKIEVRDR
jgi:hypothetical protein